MMLLGFGFLGLVVPSTTVLALDAHGSIAGTASALMGTFQFLTGAATMAIVGQFADGSARPIFPGRPWPQAVYCQRSGVVDPHNRLTREVAAGLGQVSGMRHLCPWLCERLV